MSTDAEKASRRHATVDHHQSLFSGLRGTLASDHLDLVRGLAAVAVLAYHIRYRFFLDFADISNASVLTTAWYAITAFGHDAVMVFFVVSGFLVGSSVVRDCRTGRWNWADYLTARCVRLYVVLLPGLLLTLFWDRLGLHLFGNHAVYTGVAHGYRHDFFDVAERSTLTALAGNAAFVQGIFAPTFGSNDALWSLAFEFWYYAAFPLVAIAFSRRWSVGVRTSYLLAAVALLVMLPAEMTKYFPIWLMGVGVGALKSSRMFARRPRPWMLGAGALFISWLVASHIGAVRGALGNSLWLFDTCTGAVFALWLYTMLHDRRESSEGAYGRVSRTLAGMSYTLYVVHLPLLIILRAWLVPDRPWMPDASTILYAGGVGITALLYASAVAYMTESRTAIVRRAVLSRVLRALGSKREVAVPRAGIV